MGNTTLGPVPPPPSIPGDTGGVLVRWLQQLRVRLVASLTGLSVANANGFTGTSTPNPDGSASISIAVTATGMVKGNAGSLVSATPHVDFDLTTHQVIVPLTGFSIVLADGVRNTILNPAGTLASGSIQMSPNPPDGFVQRITSEQAVTALTMTANTGQTLLLPASALTAGVGLAWQYDTATTTWYRI